MKRRSIILAAVCFSTLLSGTQVMAESKVADSSEYASVEDVVEEWMSAVSPDQLNEGTYEIAVDSSSSMFPIEHTDYGRYGISLCVSGVGRGSCRCG